VSGAWVVDGGGLEFLGWFIVISLMGENCVFFRLVLCLVLAIEVDDEADLDSAIGTSCEPFCIDFEMSSASNEDGFETSECFCLVEMHKMCLTSRRVLIQAPFPR
jgi:hypothetical protein